MRSQFVLDDETEALLNELASARAGNRSFVVREAIHLYANLEDWLDTIEANPGLQEMMASSLADLETGRMISSRELLQLQARKNRLAGTSEDKRNKNEGRQPRKTRACH